MRMSQRLTWRQRWQANKSLVRLRRTSGLRLEILRSSTVLRWHSDEAGLVSGKLLSTLFVDYEEKSRFVSREFEDGEVIESILKPELQATLRGWWIAPQPTVTMQSLSQIFLGQFYMSRRTSISTSSLLRYGLGMATQGLER